MSAIGPQQTSRVAPHTSAFGGIADIRCDDRITFEVDVAVTATEELGKAPASFQV